MKTYQEMPLADELQKALNDLNFIKPTEIQSEVIPVVMKGRDVMACAETGSGKTGAYGIPMVSRLLEDPKINALVLAPTRELAHQISDFLRELTSHCNNMQVTSLVGGADIRKQLNALKKRPRIIVATPGRCIDHLKRRSLKLETTEILVLDEGDRMLDMGFAPQLNEILKFLPKKRQTSLFTATLPDKVRKLAEKYLTKPENVNAGRVSLPVASIKQSVVQVRMKDKDECIVDELNQREGSVIIFARTQRRTDILARILDGYGFSVGLIHGGRTQGQRNKAIQNFRKGKSRILCATDIAARGLDVPQVEHVINFDLPMMKEDYVHRIGRTARNGAKGEAVSFVTPEEHRTWQALARTYKIPGVELEKVARGKNPKGRSRASKDESSNDSYSEDRPSRGGRRNFQEDKRDSRPSFKSKKRSPKDFEKSAFSKFSKGPKKKWEDSQDDRPEGRSSFKKKKRFSNDSEEGSYGKPSRGPKKEWNDAQDDRPRSSFKKKKRFSKDSEGGFSGKFSKGPKKKSTRSFQEDKPEGGFSGKFSKGPKKKSAGSFQEDKPEGRSSFKKKKKSFSKPGNYKKRSSKKSSSGQSARW